MKNSAGVAKAILSELFFADSLELASRPSTAELECYMLVGTESTVVRASEPVMSVVDTGAAQHLYRILRDTEDLLLFQHLDKNIIALSEPLC